MFPFPVFEKMKVDSLASVLPTQMHRIAPCASRKLCLRFRYFITVALVGVSVTEFAPALRFTCWPQKSGCLL